METALFHFIQEKEMSETPVKRSSLAAFPASLGNEDIHLTHFLAGVYVSTGRNRIVLKAEGVAPYRYFGLELYMGLAHFGWKTRDTFQTFGAALEWLEEDGEEPEVNLTKRQQAFLKAWQETYDLNLARERAGQLLRQEEEEEEGGEKRIVQPDSTGI
jgi:hypothetical protein